MEDLKQILTQKQEGIKGFCYNFAKSLVKKLKELLANDRIFIDGNEKCIERSNNFHTKTKIAEIVLHYIEEQFPCDYGHLLNVPEIKDLIELTEEFLAIFETKDSVTENLQIQSGSVTIPANIKNFLVSRNREYIENMRVSNCFEREGLTLVYEPIVWGDNFLLSFRNFNENSLQTWKSQLERDVTPEVFESIQTIMKGVTSTQCSNMAALMANDTFQELIRDPNFSNNFLNKPVSELMSINRKKFGKDYDRQRKINEVQSFIHSKLKNQMRDLILE